MKGCFVVRKRKEEFLSESMKKQQLIGVWGFSSGCGVTHMAIAIAVYAKQMWRHRTAYVEFNASNQITSLVGEERYWQEEFSYHGIRFYANVTREKLWQILRMGYETLILDMGTKGDRVPNEFKLCHTKMILVDGAKWKRNRLEAWLKKIEKEEVSQYQHLIPFAGKQEIRVLNHDYATNFYSIPYQQDAFCLNLPMIELLKMLV